MKQIFLAFVLVFNMLIVKAQDNTNGTVVYEQVVQLEIKLEGDAAQFASMLPKERKSEKVLYFTPKTTLFENKKETEEENMHSANGNVMIRMAEPDNKVFTDLEKGKQIEQREFMTREFLIEGEISNEWKLTGNQKMILDYPCQEAVIEKEDKKISAWFTPVIPVSAGPGNYGGLPGLILLVNVNEGKQITTAKSVDFNLVSKDVIMKPDKGKKISREEFDKIVEEKMKEMGGQQGAGGTHMMIRIQR